jgi:septal ring factor EnvC (AmiA/AmiB activator)
MPQFGLIAEEVAKVNSALVLPDRDGKPYTVRYDAVNAMLLNEFLKEHRKVEELKSAIAQQRQKFQTTVARQDQEIRALVATVKEQGTQIQKVSAQIEVSEAPLQLTAAESP